MWGIVLSPIGFLNHAEFHNHSFYEWKKIDCFERVHSLTSILLFLYVINFPFVVKWDRIRQFPYILKHLWAT